MILIYPGSFDPVTTGHVDIAKRGATIAHRLIVAVLDNPSKKTMFSVDERVAFLQNAFVNEAKIEVDYFSGLLAEYAVRRGANAILRGLRNPGDFENETRYASYNNQLSGGIETIFLSANPALSFVSSSIVRELTAYATGRGIGSDINSEINSAKIDTKSLIYSMVPPVVQVAFAKKLDIE